MTPVCTPINRVSDITVQLLDQLIDAVQLLHSVGIVHLDLRPRANLLMHDGQLYLCDLGCAALLGTSARCSAGTTVFGSPSMLDNILMDTSHSPSVSDDWHSVLRIIVYASLLPIQQRQLESLDELDHAGIDSFWRGVFGKNKYHTVLNRIEGGNDRESARALRDFVSEMLDI